MLTPLLAHAYKDCDFEVSALDINGIKSAEMVAVHSNQATSNLNNGTGVQYPNRIGSRKVANRGPAAWFNTADFAVCSAAACSRSA